MSNLKKLMEQLQDDILDEYNKGNMSQEEMSKIMQWTKRIIETKEEKPNSNVMFFKLDPDTGFLK